MTMDVEACDVCGAVWPSEDIVHTMMGKGDDAVCPDCKISDADMHSAWLDSADDLDDRDLDDLCY